MSWRLRGRHGGPGCADRHHRRESDQTTLCCHADLAQQSSGWPLTHSNADRTFHHPKDLNTFYEMLAIFLFCKTTIWRQVDDSKGEIVRSSSAQSCLSLTLSTVSCAELVSADRTRNLIKIYLDIIMVQFIQIWTNKHQLLPGPPRPSAVVVHSVPQPASLVVFHFVGGRADVALSPSRDRPDQSRHGGQLVQQRHRPLRLSPSETVRLEKQMLLTLGLSQFFGRMLFFVSLLPSSLHIFCFVIFLLKNFSLNFSCIVH